MANERFKEGDKKGPGGTEGKYWEDTKSGEHGHTGHEKTEDGTYHYHETDHKTGETKGWSWNPDDPSKNKQN